MKGDVDDTESHSPGVAEAAAAAAAAVIIDMAPRREEEEEDLVTSSSAAAASTATWLREERLLAFCLFGAVLNFRCSSCCCLLAPGRVVVFTPAMDRFASAVAILMMIGGFPKNNC